MYYFLALVKDKDLLKGNIVPSYILCKVSNPSQNYAPWRVYRPDNGQIVALKKVLVTSLVGHEEMVDFLSRYRTRDKAPNRRGKRSRASYKFYPKGALFWFPCDIYGVQKGPALFIKRVPDKSIKQSDQGKQRYESFLQYRPLMSEVLTRDKTMYPLAVVKPKLAQDKRYRKDQ